MKKIYNEKVELSQSQASNALENGNHDGYIEMTSKMQNEKIKHKIGRANDALENGNHSEHVDMPLEIKNRKILHELELRRVDNRPVKKIICFNIIVSIYDKQAQSCVTGDDNEACSSNRVS